MISTDTGIACKFPNFALFPNFFLGAMKRAENLLANQFFRDKCRRNLILGVVLSVSASRTLEF